MMIKALCEFFVVTLHCKNLFRTNILITIIMFSKQYFIVTQLVAVKEQKY